MLNSQSKSYRSGIKKAKQTNVPTILNSLKKVAHFYTFSTVLNLRFRLSKNKFVIELKWYMMTASLNISVQTPTID